MSLRITEVTPLWGVSLVIQSKFSLDLVSRGAKPGCCCMMSVGGGRGPGRDIIQPLRRAGRRESRGPATLGRRLPGGLSQLAEKAGRGALGGRRSGKPGGRE